MFDAGGLMNIRYALNMFIGIDRVRLRAPYAITHGWVSKKGVTFASDFTQARRADQLAAVAGRGDVRKREHGVLAKLQVTISAFTSVQPPARTC